jgi:hypothetical protein
MPKVELEKIRLAVTAITNTVVATIPSKDNRTMLHKHDVTSDFLKCIIDYGANSRWNIAGEEGSNVKEYEVACVEKKRYKRVLYTRKEVVKLLAEMIKDDVGEKINLEQWMEKKLK